MGGPSDVPQAARGAEKQRYRVHSDDVALPEVHTGQVTHNDAPEIPEKHKSINYENVAIPEVHIPKKKP